MSNTLYSYHSDPKKLDGYNQVKRIPFVALSMAMHYDEGTMDYRLVKKPDPEAMRTIVSIPSIAADYAIYGLKRPWPKTELGNTAEKTIFNSNTGDLHRYASVYQTRWPEYEQKLFDTRDIVHLLDYANRHFRKTRWPELEQILTEYPAEAMEYASTRFPKSRWPELEQELPKHPIEAAKYANTRFPKSRWIEMEPYIAQDGEAAALYANYNLRGPWPEDTEVGMQARQSIAKVPDRAVNYAFLVLKSPFPEAEPYISGQLVNPIHPATPERSYRYLTMVRVPQNKPWPEAEKLFSKDAKIALKYALEILKSKWPKNENGAAAEKLIMADDFGYTDSLGFSKVTNEEIDLLKSMRKKYLALPDFKDNIDQEQQ